MILFISIKDWANMGLMLSRCLRKVGVDAEAITVEPTRFQYMDMPHHTPTAESMKPFLDAAEVIVFMHSNPNLLTIPYDFGKKKCAVFHGGSEYRNKPEAINELFNEKVYVSLVQTASLLKLGAKNEQWVMPPVDTDFIRPVKTNNERTIVGHFPRSALVKGTEEINRVVCSLSWKHKFHYLFSAYQVDWMENLRRMARCDIYIAAMKPMLSGKPYGGGIEVTDLESAALGKVTVTHFACHLERYIREFGNRLPLYIANEPKELFDTLDLLLGISRKELDDIKDETRAWVEKNHSYEAVGKRLREVLKV